MYLTIDDQEQRITSYGNSARYWASTEELVKYLKKRYFRLEKRTATTVLSGRPVRLGQVKMTFRVYLLTRNASNGPSIYYVSPNEDKFPARITGQDLVWLAEEVGILKTDEDPLEKGLLLSIGN